MYSLVLIDFKLQTMRLKHANSWWMILFFVHHKSLRFGAWKQYDKFNDV